VNPQAVSARLRRLRKQHREILLLAVLSLVAATMFLITRSLANESRRMHSRMAGEWFVRGNQLMDAGDVALATDAYRRAVTHDRQNTDLRLALGRALARREDAEEARMMLLQLRETAPENGELNLELGRLFSRVPDVENAARYYHNALYGVWPEKEIDQRRRQVRRELIDFLLANGQNNEALSEILAFSRDVPETAADRVVVGELFFRGGDAARALDQFTQALALEADNTTALLNAGRAAFEMGDYRRAVRYLEALKQSPQRDRMLHVARSVVADDPLAGRLSASTRYARLIRLLDASLARLKECRDQLASQANSAAPDLSALLTEAMDVRSNLTPSRIARDSDLVQGGIDMAFKSEVALTPLCGSSEDGQALMLIARLHGVVESE
jgi:tetratricopeptide (TPR) repeat protein